MCFNIYIISQLHISVALVTIMRATITGILIKYKIFQVNFLVYFIRIIIKMVSEAK